MFSKKPSAAEASESVYMRERVKARPTNMGTLSNSGFNSLCGKAAICLESMLCGVLVWENQETHE